MPTDYKVFTSAEATAIFSQVWDVLTDNTAGVFILLGGMLGLTILARLINGARRGKVRV